MESFKRTFRKGLLALVAIATTFALVGVGTASAENVNFTFNDGQIQLSDTWAQIITPTDDPARLAAEVGDDGAVSAPASNFSFPTKTIEGLEASGLTVDAKIEISASGPITGTFDKATGTTPGIIVPAQALISVFTSGATGEPLGACRVSGFSLDLATTGQLSDPGSAGPPVRPAQDFDAAPFGLPSGEGAVVGTWPSLPNSTEEGGSLPAIVCPAVDGLVGGPGGIWLSGTALAGPPYIPGAPAAAPEITKFPEATTDSNSAEFAFTKGAAETQSVTGFQCRVDAGTWGACNDGTKKYGGVQSGVHTFDVKATNAKGEGPVASKSWTVNGTTPPIGKAKLGALKIKPKSKAVKPGKKATFKVNVKNVGDATAKGVKVCVKAPKKLVKVKKCVKIGNLAAGKARNAKFKVKVGKKAKKGKKATLKFKATSSNAGAKSGKATVKIK